MALTFRFQDWLEDPCLAWSRASVQIWEEGVSFCGPLLSWPKSFLSFSNFFGLLSANSDAVSTKDQEFYFKIFHFAENCFHLFRPYIS